MYCKFYDEEYDDCSSCDRTYSCEQRKQMKKEDQEAITLSIKESELFKKSTALLSGFFNLSEEEINDLRSRSHRIIINFTLLLFILIISVNNFLI